MFTNLEQAKLETLFVKGGNVFDFSIERLDEFTFGSTGIKLCDKYKLSKGKSLMKFIREGEDEKVIKLVEELLEYYEFKCFEKLDKNLYDECKTIIGKSKENRNDFQQVANELKEKFSTEYMDQQISIMMGMCKINPTEAIGK